ncbi:MAG: hypothetical protein RLZZ58_656 [Pseudomonadota bacterium]
MTVPFTGHCHCGAVAITMPMPIHEVLHCNCTLCTKSGWLGVYGDPTAIVIAGSDQCDAYIWGDKMIAIWHCRTCGIATHWTPLPGTPPDRMGVNVRLFEPEVWQSLPVRRVDGRSM